MKHRLLNLLTALSLLLSVAACLLWFRSYRSADIFSGCYGPTHSGPGYPDGWRASRGFEISHVRGGIVVRHMSHVLAESPGWRLAWGHESKAADPQLASAMRAGLNRPHAWRGAGFGYGAIEAEEWTAAVPDYAVVALTAVPPAWWLVRRVRRAKALRAGRCRACGYDLTGNVSGVCPECGAAEK